MGGVNSNQIGSASLPFFGFIPILNPLCINYISRKILWKSLFAFSILWYNNRRTQRSFGGIAQLGERYTGSVEVMSSNLTVSRRIKVGKPVNTRLNSDKELITYQLLADGFGCTRKSRLISKQEVRRDFYWGLGFLLYSRAFICRELDIRVAKVVIANLSQAVMLRQERKRRGSISRPNQVPHFIYAQIARRLFAVRASAQQTISRLFFFYSRQFFTKIGNKRHGSHRRFCFVLSEAVKTCFPDFRNKNLLKIRYFNSALFLFKKQFSVTLPALR